jgi:hypothetical protein
MTDERRERHLTRRPGGALVDERALREMLADWDRRAAAARPVVARLSLTRLTEHPAPGSSDLAVDDSGASA